MLVRVPFHSGATSYWAVARGLAALFFGLTLVAWRVVDAYFDGLSFQGVGGLGVFVWTTTLSLALLSYAWTMLVRAWHTRPRDWLLSESGLAVDEGGSRRLRIAWEEIDLERSTLEQRLHWMMSGELLLLVVFFPVGFIFGIFELLNWLLGVEKDVEPRTPLGHLTIRDRKGVVRLEAVAEELVDIECLAAVLELASTRAARVDAPTANEETRAELVHCTQCGAPCEAEAYGLTKCEHCGHRFDPPEKLRGQLELDREAESEVTEQHALLDALLGRRGVQSARRWILGIAAGSWLVQLAIVGFGTEFDLPLPTSTPFNRLLLLGSCVVVALGLVGDFVFFDRQAVYSLQSEFAARAPRSGRGAPECRQCGAPLEPKPRAVIASCAHCRAENVLDIDLRPFVEGAQATTRSLDELLREHRANRSAARKKSAVAAVCALALLGWFASEAHDGVRNLRKYNVVFTKRFGTVWRRAR